MENAVKELRAAHAETIQELEKTRSLLSTESRISQGYKVEQTHPPTFILTVCKAARGGVRAELSLNLITFVVLSRICFLSRGRRPSWTPRYARWMPTKSSTSRS